MTNDVKLHIMKCVFIMLAFIPNFDKIRFQNKTISKKSKFFNKKMT